MGVDLKGRLNQSVPETREVNLYGLYLISNMNILEFRLRELELMELSRMTMLFGSHEDSIDVFEMQGYIVVASGLWISQKPDFHRFYIQSMDSGGIYPGKML